MTQKSINSIPNADKIWEEIKAEIANDVPSLRIPGDKTVLEFAEECKLTYAQSKAYLDKLYKQGRIARHKIKIGRAICYAYYPKTD